MVAILDACLEGRDGEGLHNLAGRLGLDHVDLAECLPLAGLGGGLHAGLDAAQAGDGEDTVALDLLRGDLRQCVQDLGADRLLKLRRSVCGSPAT